MKEEKMEKKEKAGMSPPFMLVYGSELPGGIPVFDPRSDDYTGFVMQASAR